MQKSLSYLKRLSFEASPLKWIVLAAVSDYLLLVCWHSRRVPGARYPANAEPGIEPAQHGPRLTIELRQRTTGFQLHCTFVLLPDLGKIYNKKLKNKLRRELQECYNVMCDISSNSADAESCCLSS